MDFKTGIIIFNNGAFGGAAKRITNLFFHLNSMFVNRFYLFVNPHLMNQIDYIYKNTDKKNILLIDDGLPETIIEDSDEPRLYYDNIPDPDELDKNTSFPRKVYWYYKNKQRQKKLFDQIESKREELDLKILNGIAAGALPLIFYKEEPNKDVFIIFSNMDSWFTDVHSDMKKLWYRKYYSYNDILKKADMVDFLSPYVAEGIKNKGIHINESKTSIAPCSFIDHTLCKQSTKQNTEIAFSSRLEPDKNPLIYLEAAADIINKYPDIKFHLLGEGSLVREIKKFISLHKLENNINFIFHKNPVEILYETSIFVSLQTGTNYPSQSVLEAMSCGNAIIASNRGDTHLFINNDNGLLIDLNKDELTNAMEKLINDKELCRRLGENGRKQVIEQHNIDRYTDYYLKILNKTIL